MEYWSGPGQQYHKLTQQRNSSDLLIVNIGVSISVHHARRAMLFQLSGFGGSKIPQLEIVFVSA